jgi:uncharacterized RDD family membrane protein YckC
MKINGWQRIGIIIAITWMASAAVYHRASVPRSGFTQWASHSAYEKCKEVNSLSGNWEESYRRYRRNYDGNNTLLGKSTWQYVYEKGNDNYSKCRNERDKAFERARWVETAAISLLPILFGWLSVYLLIWIFRWVKAGFTSGHPSEVQQENVPIQEPHPESALESNPHQPPLTDTAESGEAELKSALRKTTQGDLVSENTKSEKVSAWNYFGIGVGIFMLLVYLFSIFKDTHANGQYLASTYLLVASCVGIIICNALIIFREKPRQIPSEKKLDEATLGKKVSYGQLYNAQTSVALVRPWIRCWARLFDMTVFSIIFVILLGIMLPSLFDPNLEPQVQNSNNSGVAITSIFAWVFVEGFLLSSFGTTPGRWLFKTKLTLASGKSIKYSQALVRCFKVWVRGMGLGFPFVNLFTMFIEYRRLKRNRITSWDREENFVVTHEKIGVPRVLVAIGFLVTFLVFITAAKSM